MNVWLLHVGEDLVEIDDNARKFRYGYLADALVASGASVTRWAPTFRHVTKQHRFHSDRRIAVGPRYDVQFVHSPGYGSHISRARQRTYRVLADRFRELADGMPRPDAIIAAIPSLEWAQAAVRFGKALGVPVFVDIRDPWPEVYASIAPAPLRALARILLSRDYARLGEICRGADALLAVSPSYLNWALEHGGRAATPEDAVIPLGFAQPSEPTAEARRAISELNLDPSTPTLTYTGQFARSSDVGTLLKAVERLQDNGTPVQLLLCGDGAERNRLERQAAPLRGVHFLGWVDGPTMTAAMEASQIGVAAYSARATQSLPNKPFEYLANGLPIASSLRGDLEDLIDRHNVGFSYRAGDATDLATRLGSALANRNRLADQSARARKVWESHYQPESVYGRFADHLCRQLPASRAA